MRRAAAQLPTRLRRLDPEAMIRPARRMFGAAEVGFDEVIEPISVFADACNAEDNLTPFGSVWARLLCHDLLSHRAEVSRTLRQTPAILDVPIRKPIFVLGLPRTGTTLLHNLMACDAQSRVPVLWEAYAPTRPIPKGSWRATMSLARDTPRLAINEWLNPGLRAIHPLDTDRPAECFWMLQHSFVELHFFLIFGAWRYLDWLRTQDHVASYGYYKKLLQILMYQRSEDRLVLKYPFHSTQLDALLHWFPDARFVQIHRDPAQVVPSMASLTATLMKPNCVHRDLARIGGATLDTLSHAAEVGHRARARLPSSRFFDVSYEDFTSDPVRTVERLYDHFGLAGSPDLSRKMTEFVAQNPQNQYGVHHYRAEDYALDPARIAASFAGPALQARSA
jgi:hypothetical protein